MTTAYTPPVTRNDTTVTLGRAKAEVSSPTEGVLRMLFRRGDGFGNYAVAVQPPGEPRALSIGEDRVEAEGIALIRSGDEAWEIWAASPAASLERVLRLTSVYSSEGDFTAVLSVGKDDPFFGMGELTGPMNRRHRRCVNWNLDYAPHTPSTPSFYASFPMFVSRARGASDRSVWYGLFLDNAGQSTFDFATEAPDRVSIAVRTGDLDLYLIAGPAPAAVVRRYCALTGTMEMPPRWMFGYQQSRWSYTPAERVRDVARQFRRNRFPCDVLYLDIDYMDRFRAFTWDKERFPDPGNLLQELHAQGFRVIPILNSAVAVDPDFPIYREGHANGYFLKHPDGREYHDEMWPGLSAFPDFTREDVRRWWGGLHADLLDIGVDGVWNDMNEPTIFGEKKSLTFPVDLVHTGEGAPRPHKEVHNAYAMLMGMATHEGLRTLRPGRRLPLLSRAAFAGMQRYASVWTGDNSAWWDHMRLAIAQVGNLGMCGLPISGPDVGGFHDDASGELFLRWLQMCVFFPYLRAHSMKGSKDAEPWAFGDQILDLGKRFVALRYALLPYVYSLAAQAARHGDPILRPMFYEFPQDPSCETADDQFMLGPDILVAPILAPGHFYRAVYLPEGQWYSFFGETLFEGAQVYVAETPLDHIPVFVRANAAIPMMEPVQSTAEARPAHIRWEIWPSRGQGSGWLYEDDGETDGEARASRGFCETRVRGDFDPDSLQIVFEARHGDYDPGKRRFEIVLHGKRWLPRTSSLGGVTQRGDCVCASFEDDGSAREIRMAWS